MSKLISGIFYWVRELPYVRYYFIKNPKLHVVIKLT